MGTKRLTGTYAYTHVASGRCSIPAVGGGVARAVDEAIDPSVTNFRADAGRAVLFRAVGHPSRWGAGEHGIVEARALTRHAGNPREDAGGRLAAAAVGGPQAPGTTSIEGERHRKESHDGEDQAKQFRNHGRLFHSAEFFVKPRGASQAIPKKRTQVRSVASMAAVFSVALMTAMLTPGA